ncbi:MAG: sugar ABC transporter ATP-binding protein [Rhodospirillaceae bacterium]|nr:sugar ABC transporter ATP-binding protein [Rhodospirillaceae bacterium]MYK14452.1 sugar ABC transporter ATP-binding protein [Rhodospirillaceae bacterium]
MAHPVLAARGMTKSFGNNDVLRNIDFDIAASRNIALCGENGAGKSTLIKLMTGIYAPTAGQVLVDGNPVDFSGPKEAIAAGIAVVHQEFSTLRALTVAENVFMEMEPRNRLGLVDRRRLRRDCIDLLGQLGIDLDPDVELGRLSVAEAQMVEIAKALRSQARVLILDEPTAVLSHREIDHLFRILRDLRERGLGLVYVSHRLDEIFEICTDICVLKDGEVTSAGPIGRYDHDTVVAAMVGRSLGELFPPKGAPVSDRTPVLSVRGLAVDGGTDRADLDVRPGEIVGLAGLVGSGRTELALAIFGAATGAGTVELHGTAYGRRTPGNSLDTGMAMLTENRKADGLFLDASVAWNFAATTLGKDARAFALSPLDEERRSRSVVERFNVAVDHVGQPISALSGGNQQKVLIGRLLENAPTILLLDEPTRGVDVATKAEIYRTLRALAEDGVAILVISSELIEIVGLCDRVLVMRDGVIAAELDGASITEDGIMAVAAGSGTLGDGIEGHV